MATRNLDLVQQQELDTRRFPRGLNPRAEHVQLDRILERGLVRAVYQPIVELDSGEVAAVEALARGPAGSPLESPAAMFGVARRAGRLHDLEWACRAAAIEGALEANLGTQVTLFLNVEPSVVGAGIPVQYEQLFRTAERKLRMVLELTERDLCKRPAELLNLVAWARNRWWGVALDDVGAEPESLALLPFIEPDVIKLDMRLVQEGRTEANAALIEDVNVHAERFGASVLAEGIETEGQVEVARSLGAGLGQGWHFGRPGPLAPLGRPRGTIKLLPPPRRTTDRTPFDVLVESAGSEIVASTELLDASRRLEQRAMQHDDNPVVLTCVGHADRIEYDLAKRYDTLGRTCVFVGMLGQEMPAEPATGVRGTPLVGTDPLCGEWVVTVISPRFAGAVAARQLGDSTNSFDDEVEMVVCEDRTAVLDAARILMAKVVPARR